MPHPLSALVFELEFTATIQEYEGKHVCLGFGVFLPELNTVGALIDKDV